MVKDMIYLDNAATTRMYEECIDDFRHYAVEQYFNPSALYNSSIEVVHSIRNARETIAKSLHASRDEIIFTASGSEADNLAIFGCLHKKNKKVIVSAVEHSAVYNSAVELKNMGYKVIFAPVDRYGRVDTDALENIIDEDVVLVSIMHVCNETGALNDIKKIAEIVREYADRDAIFHVDGVQSYNKFDINVKALDIDLFSMSAHKVHGPKGVGALYVRKGVKLKPIIYGGGQEFGIRSATENVAGIMAFARAVEHNMSTPDYGYGDKKAMLKAISERFVSEYGDHVIVNTDFEHCAPNILSVAFDNIRGEVMQHALEKHGIIVGTGSACSSHKATRRIPLALGVLGAFQDGMIRISLSNESKMQELDALMDAFRVEYNELKRFG